MTYFFHRSPLVCVDTYRFLQRFGMIIVSSCSYRNLIMNTLDYKGLCVVYSYVFINVHISSEVL